MTMASATMPMGSARAAPLGRARGKSAAPRAARMRIPRRGVSVVAAASQRDDQPENWQLKYLYDGGCTVCNSLVKLLKSKKGHEKIWCVDVAARRSRDTSNAQPLRVQSAKPA